MSRLQLCDPLIVGRSLALRAIVSLSLNDFQINEDILIRRLIVSPARLACRSGIAVELAFMNGLFTNPDRRIAAPAPWRSTPWGAHGSLGQSLPIRSLATVIASAACCMSGLATISRAQTIDETLERSNGERVVGSLEGDVRAGFRFRARRSGAPVAIEAGAIIQSDGSSADSLAGLPPFHVTAGETLSLSGLVQSISESSVRIKLSWQSEEIVLPRPGVQSVIQRPGEARVVAEGFDRLDRSRWAIEGKASIVNDPALSGKTSLRLPCDGASLKYRLGEPIAAGKIDLAFFDEGSVVPGRQWFLELVFEGSFEPVVIKIDLGWSEESLAVSCPRGPSLPVQRLARTRGWHRLMVRFGSRLTEISVDGKELAHGKSPSGQLSTIRLASSPVASATNPKEPASYIDDLQIIRFAEPAASVEIDVTQDEARLVTGDQLFGEFRKADAEKVVMSVEGKSINLSWNEVAGLYFRRLPAQGATVEGLLARVEWRAAAGSDPVDLDFAEGAITAVSAQAITLATPYAGVLRIPRARVRKVVMFGEARRVVFDPAAHHLGDEPSRAAPLLDPPLNEGGILERTVELTDVPDGQASLVLDVLGVVGEDNDPIFSQYVRNGELRTWVVINGQRVDFLNHYVKSPDMAERIAIPIPPHLLRAGKNTVRLELTGMADKADHLDDFGLLTIALEFRRKPRTPPGPSQ
jgi:hypothetical protein